MNDTLSDVERVERARRDELCAILATPGGRRAIWRLIDGAGVFRASYSGDALATAYNEGRRAVGLGLMMEAQQASIDGYVLMVSEQLTAARMAALLRESGPRNE